MTDQTKNLERIRGNAYMKFHGIELAELDDDRAVLKMEAAPELRNPFGALQAGAFYTLAVAAAGTAARTDGRDYVTQNGGVRYIRGKKEGSVTAEARVRHRGRSTCLVDVDLCGEDDRLLATAEFTFFCTAK